MSIKLSEIRKRLVEQDNRCTDQPMFCVQEKHRDYGFDPSFTDNAVWVDITDGFRVVTANHPGAIKIGYKDSWYTVMVCFTEEGCNEYLQNNGHNLGETRIYVESFNRCPEMIAIRKFIMDITHEDI